MRLNMVIAVALIDMSIFLATISFAGYFVKPTALKINILDVGQGDAILITTPDYKYILIDGGPDQNILAPLAEHLPYLKQALDLLVITHPHADHLDGALAVLNRYQVRGLLLTGVTYKSTNYQRLVAQARDRGIPIFQAQANMDWQIAQNIYLDILFPFEPLRNNNAFKNINNASLVFRLITPKESIFFAADMEKELEKVLLYYYQYDLASTFLKVAHHGSSTSSTSAFLAVLKPKEMWISAGESNVYGHPNDMTLMRLAQYGNIIRTDKVGTITKFLLQ